MKVVFMGTPDFAVPSLKMLIEKNFEVVAVVTQPDKPKGRGHAMTMPPVKEVALINGIEVYQPKRAKDSEFVNILKSLNPDVIIVIAFGQILSKEILEIPKYGCINVHGSILPEYRGASPIQSAILDGKTETGVTTMIMDEGIDTGDMLLKNKINITLFDTAGSMHERLSVLGAETLYNTLINIETIEPKKQDDSKATYAKMFDKKMGLIDWNKSSKEIINLIRGLDPWPSAYTYYNETMMKVWKVVEFKTNKHGVCGEIVESINDKGIVVKTGDGHVLIEEMQAEGKKRMKTKEYMKGNKLEEGVILGNIG